VDFHYSGFEWMDFHDWENSIIAFVRRAEDAHDFLLICCNFTPVMRQNYEFPVPSAGYYEEIFNTDAERFGGSGVGNPGGVWSVASQREGKHRIAVTLPPLAVVVFRPAVRP
jgi:1,4-alpha-glucan branching enzyme